MAEKFPEISDIPDADDQPSGDFLSREKELLGDEFTTEQDKQVEPESEEDEFGEFKSQFPEVGSEPAPEALPASGAAEAEVTEQFDSLSVNNANDSPAIAEWREKYNAEIAKRDEINAKKLEELKAEAQKATDDFYENSNNKRDEQVETTRKEEEEFLKKRDSFLEHGTVWQRVVELLKLDKNSASVDDEAFRDKTRFKEILLTLKDKPDAPAAQGVSQ